MNKAPIPTPANAILVNDLPQTTRDDTGIFTLVQTDTGTKKMPISQAQELPSYMIGSVQPFFGNDENMALYSVPLLGGVLNPNNYQDNLVSLKNRIPSTWILPDGRVQLPNMDDRVLGQDTRLAAGSFEDDAIRNINATWTGYGIDTPSLNATGAASDIYYPGQGDLPCCAPNGIPRHKVTFDASKVVPTADVNRERTLNVIYFIMLPYLKNVENIQRCRLLFGATESPIILSLAQVEGGEVVGFNSETMKVEVSKMSKVSRARGLKKG